MEKKTGKLEAISSFPSLLPDRDATGLEMVRKKMFKVREFYFELDKINILIN